MARRKRLPKQLIFRDSFQYPLPMPHGNNCLSQLVAYDQGVSSWNVRSEDIQSRLRSRFRTITPPSAARTDAPRECPAAVARKNTLPTAGR